MPRSSCQVFDCTNPASPVPIGAFELSSLEQARFVYKEQYLQDVRAFPVDPIHAPLQRPPIAVRRGGDGSFGVFTDAAPTGWGAHLTLKLLRDLNQKGPQNAVEWLLSSHLNGSGCLGFATDQETLPHVKNEIQASRALTPAALEAIEAYTIDPSVQLDLETERLLSPGSSLGGMRPKTLVMHERVEHIAKLGRPDDPIDVPAAEYATLRLATRAGIDVPSFELVSIGERSVLMIERFDRKDGQHIHYASAQSFLDPQPLSADGREFVKHYSYAGIVESLRPFALDARTDSHELFRRMVLNIMVGNVDDHLRNHAFLMVQPGLYRFSPVFDIVPHLEAANRPQSIGVGEFGPASTIANALSQCNRFLLSEAEAREIISEVKDVASTWRREFHEAGISQRDINAVAECFNAADQAERVQISASLPALRVNYGDDVKIQRRCVELGLSLDRAKRFVETADHLATLAAILGLDAKTLAPLQPKRWIWMAAQSSSVSYRLSLSEEQLSKALITGCVDQEYSAHLCTLFDEVPYPITLMAIFQAASDGGVPMTVIWRNVEHLARSVGARYLDLWTSEN